MKARQWLELQSKKMAEWFRSTSLVQRLILMVLVVGMLLIWPLCLIREKAENRSGDYGHAFSQALQPGTAVVQRFEAQKKYLKSIGYVLKFNAELPLEGEFSFELLDEEGTVLFTKRIPYNLTPQYAYCEVKVNKWLDAGAIYQFRLTNISVQDNLPQLVYTDREKMDAVNNCGLTVDGQMVRGEALTRYTWMAPMSPERTLAVWGVMGVVAWPLYEFCRNNKCNK